MRNMIFSMTSLEDAKRSLPKVKNKKHTVPEDYYDDHFKLLIARRKDLRRHPKSEQNPGQMKRLNREIKRAASKVKNRMLQDKSKEINEAKQNRKIADMWRNAKNHSKIIKNKPKAIACPNLASHFKAHFNPHQSNITLPEDIANPPQCINELHSCVPEINNLPPTLDEILLAISDLKNGKSSLDIEADLLKTAAEVPEFQEELKNYFNEIWNKRKTPSQWSLSRVIPIWKRKGSARDPKQYRAISVGPILTKVGMNISLRRLTPLYEQQLSTTQFGFRAGNGCNDGIFVMKQLQEVAYRSKRKLYTCYIDLTAAFDHVNRSFLFESIRKRIPPSCDTTNIDVIKSLYEDTKSFLSGEDTHKDQFPTISGVRQGGNEGPILFNLYEDYAVRIWDHRCSTTGADRLSVQYFIPPAATNRTQRSKFRSSGIYNHPDCGYADDIGIHSWSVGNLQLIINILVEVFSEFCLNINELKTETMVWNWDEKTDGPQPESIIKIKGTAVKNSKEFKYLGVWNTCDNIHIGDREVKHRIASARGTFAEHCQMLTNRNIPLKLRINLMNSLVRSRLTYGCHAWRPTQTEMYKIESMYNFILRSMVFAGFKRKNPPSSSTDDNADIDWGFILTNKELHSITNTSSITDFYMNQQMNWCSHVIRRENNHPCKMLAFHVTKNKRKGRLTPSIIDNAVKYSGVSRSQFIKDSFNRHH